MNNFKAAIHVNGYFVENADDITYIHEKFQFHL